MKRFIISINEQDGDFDISTPDGHIEYSTLVSIIDLVFSILIENDPDRSRQEEEQYEEEEKTPVSDPRKLN